MTLWPLRGTADARFARFFINNPHVRKPFPCVYTDTVKFSLKSFFTLEYPATFPFYIGTDSYPNEASNSSLDRSRRVLQDGIIYCHILILGDVFFMNPTI